MLANKFKGMTFSAMSVSLFVSASLWAAENKYSLGIVPQFNAVKVQKIWQPVVSEIFQEHGIQLEIKYSKSIPEFEEGLALGAFDCAYMNPYHLIKAREKKQYIPIVRDNGRKLYGIIVTAKKSGVTDISQLDKQVVAFPAPNALGASLLPRTEFAEQFKINITPKYVKSHDSVYLNVALGKVNAGGGVQKTFNKQPESIKKRLKVIYATRKLAPHPVACHKRIGLDVISKIKSAFIKLGETESGQKMLQKIPMKKIGEAKMLDYEVLRNMGLDKYYVE